MRQRVELTTESYIGLQTGLGTLGGGPQVKNFVGSGVGADFSRQTPIIEESNVLPKKEN